jgi:hypothetical protein
MPLFNNNKPEEEFKTLDEELRDNRISSFKIDYIQEAKKKLSKEKYIEYLENELGLALAALMKSVRFANALDVAKAENRKI